MAHLHQQIKWHISNHPDLADQGFPAFSFCCNPLSPRYSAWSKVGTGKWWKSLLHLLQTDMPLHKKNLCCRIPASKVGKMLFLSVWLGSTLPSSYNSPATKFATCMWPDKAKDINFIWVVNVGKYTSSPSLASRVTRVPCSCLVIHNATSDFSAIKQKWQAIGQRIWGLRTCL